MREFLKISGLSILFGALAIAVVSVIIFSPPAFLVSWAIALASTPAYAFFGAWGISLSMTTFAVAAVVAISAIEWGFNKLIDWAVGRSRQQEKLGASRTSVESDVEPIISGTSPVVVMDLVGNAPVRTATLVVAPVAGPSPLAQKTHGVNRHQIFTISTDRLLPDSTNRVFEYQP